MIRLLGAGAFAWVYEAVDLDLEIPVALKILRPEYAGVLNAETRFRREATTAARLRHHNIVTIRDVGQIDGASFVAMDLMPLTLARRLEVLERLPETEVVRMALDVAAALSIAHADGIVHRDIKPDNVLLGPNGEAVVADFGLAGAFTNNRGKPASEISDPNQVMGTPHYFSPEQARGLELDGRADLYALGVTCYRAATGRVPFEGDDWYTVARQHIEAEVVPPRTLVPELSEGFEAIVMRLLAKSPEQRFATASQLVDALLVLPTAPRSRSLSLVPTDASVTQISSPFIGMAVVPARTTRLRKFVVGGIAAIVIATVTVFALPSVAGVTLQQLMRGTFKPTPAVVIDSPTVAPPTSTPTTTPITTDTTQKLAITTLAPKRPANGGRKPAVAGKVHVELLAPDSAELFVNDGSVGRGKWTGDLAAGKQKFRAVLSRGVTDCWSTRHDSTVALSGPEVNQIYLDVGACSVVTLVVKDGANAEYTISAANFVFEKTGKYAGSPLRIVLRNGTYQLSLQKERCTHYSDKLIVGRDSVTGADSVTRTVSMLCGELQ